MSIDPMVGQSAIAVHEHAERPWGSWLVLAAEPGYKVKRILVHPGQRLSLQRHTHRGEHWFVAQGRIAATVNERVRVMEVGESCDVARGAEHRLANIGSIDAIVIEVQRGAYCEEDDIERLHDDYGRKPDPTATSD